jgi:predicted nucleic acid-binding protein
MIVSKAEKIILIDADVVSHFIEEGEILYLPKIFPFKIYILDKVMRELERFPKRKHEVENLINLKLLFQIPFPANQHEIVKEYYYIKEKLFKGDGESACLAMARHNKNILASNNLRDIKSYCEMHKIVYLTTMHFLCFALQKGIFDESRCDAFISVIKNKNGRLPVTKMSDFYCPDKWIFE